MSADWSLDPFVLEHPDATAFEDNRFGAVLEHWRSLARVGDLPPAEAIEPTRWSSSWAG